MPTAEFEEEADTGVITDPLAKLDRRSKNTSIAVKAAQTTLSTISRRFEETDAQNKIDHARFERTLSELGGDVRLLNGQVSDLRETAARSEVKLEGIAQAIAEQREFKHTVQTAQIETWTAREKAETEITAKKTKLRSELWWTLARRVGVAAIAGIAVLVTHLAEHC